MKILVTMALALTTTVAVPARAEEAPPTRVISYQDLDLSNQAGQRELVHRVRMAATAVCDPGRTPGGSVPTIKAVEQCRHHAYWGAKPQLELAFDRALHGTVQVAENSRPQGIAVTGGR